jgi:hypothetical protein
MAKRNTKPNGLRTSIPADPWVDDGRGLFERQPVIDCEAPVGKYEIDAIVLEMMGSGAILRVRSEVKQVREARILVDVAGAYAIRRARDEISEPSKFAEATRFLELLSSMKEAGRATRRTTVEDVAAVVARADDVGPFEDDITTAAESFKFAERATQELLDKISALTGDLDRFLNRYSVSPRSGSSSEPLTNWFIYNCALGWHDLTGSWPKRDSCVDLRRFLAAGWTDLRFPNDGKGLHHADPPPWCEPSSEFSAVRRWPLKPSFALAAAFRLPRRHRAARRRGCTAGAPA